VHSCINKYIKHGSFLSLCIGDNHWTVLEHALILISNMNAVTDISIYGFE